MELGDIKIGKRYNHKIVDAILSQSEDIKNLGTDNSFFIVMAFMALFDSVLGLELLPE